MINLWKQHEVLQNGVINMAENIKGENITRMCTECVINIDEFLEN